MIYRQGCTSDKLWNVTGLLKYLSSNQGGHVQIIIDPEAISLAETGFYDILDCFNFAQVDILTCNPFEKHSKYNIIFGLVDVWFSNQSVDTEMHCWNKSKKFYCLYGRPTAGRLGIGSYIKTHYSQDSHIHFSFPADVNNANQFELDKLLSWQVSSITDVGNIIQEFPILLDKSDSYTAFNGYNYNDPLTRFYKDILVDVVVETHVAGNTFFPTEKTLRPMWLKKPFVIFASSNYLHYLRQMGFRTFSDFWDEDYDGYEGRDRFRKMLSLIDWIANKSYSELETMYWDMQYTLEHNYNLLVNKQYTTNIIEIE